MLSHKIELTPNNKAKTHFRKAMGCARLAYNWGLNRWQEKHKAKEKFSARDLRAEFNSLKKTKFPFVTEVSKYATAKPFDNLDNAFKRFFKNVAKKAKTTTKTKKKQKNKCGYPQFKKRRNGGNFYLGNDVIQLGMKLDGKFIKLMNNQHLVEADKDLVKYIFIPKLGWVKLTESPRFSGKILSATVSERAGRYFVSLNFDIERPLSSNSKGLGIDVGIKNMVMTSVGLAVASPKPLTKLGKKLKRLSRQLSKKQHPKTKDDETKLSNNHKKASRKLAKLHKRIADIRQDFTHKLTSCLCRHASYFGLEHLNVKDMMRNRRLAKHIADVAFYEFKRQLLYKSDHKIHEVDQFYPSSKTCSCCKNVKSDLKLSDRIYHCEHCGIELDRDYNASLNLLNELQSQVGQVLPEFTPADLLALSDDLLKNRLTTSKVDTGMQPKSFKIF